LEYLRSSHAQIPLRLFHRGRFQTASLGEVSVGHLASGIPVVSGDAVRATCGVWRTVLLVSHLHSLQGGVGETLLKCKHLLLLETPKQIRGVCTELASVMHGSDLQEHCTLCRDGRRAGGVWYYGALGACLWIGSTGILTPSIEYNGNSGAEVPHGDTWCCDLRLTPTPV